MSTIDIHHFERQYEHTMTILEQSNLSERNRSLIRAFCDACLLRQVCAKVRLIRAIGALMLVARLAEKELDAIGRADVERILTTLMRRQPAYSPETIATYKRILRRFLTYVAHPDTFPHSSIPPSVDWMTTHLRKRDQRRIKRADLLTPEDIDGLIRNAETARDRAFVAALWEAGPRIAEIGNMQIKDATRSVYGYSLTMTGKTGTRNPLVISSAPHLAAWLAAHPDGKNPEAPLWPDRLSGHPIGYNTIRYILAHIFKRAAVTKPANPHNFRHSRVTFVLANGIMNEQQAKQYFGWGPDSNMPGSTYAHLIDSDVNNAILRENHLAPSQVEHDQLRPIRCHNCQLLNAAKTEFCTKCGAVLDMKKAYEHQQLHDAKEQLFTSMFKLLVEKGLVDEAAREVHDANLGTTLKRLAHSVRRDQP